MTTVYKFKAGFTKLGIATAPSSAPTITIVDSADNILVNAQATTALSNMVGAYLYSYSGADGLDLVGKFTTADLTMDAQDLFATPDVFSLMATATALSTLQVNVTTILADYARRTGDYSVYDGNDTPGIATILADYARRTGDYSTLVAGDQMDLVDAPNGLAITAIQSGLLASGDARLDNLDAPISGIPTTPVLDNDVRLDNLNAAVGSIPTNPLLATDTRLNNLNATVSSRATPADVTVAASSVAVSELVAQSVIKGQLVIQSHYTLRQTVKSTTTSDLSSATKVWLAIKESPLHEDVNALIFLERTAGLTRVNKNAHSSITDGSITITGAAGNWSIALMLDENATGLLSVWNSTTALYPVELKALVGTDTILVWSGKCVISAGIVRAVS